MLPHTVWGLLPVQFFRISSIHRVAPSVSGRVDVPMDLPIAQRRCFQGVFHLLIAVAASGVHVLPHRAADQEIVLRPPAASPSVAREVAGEVAIGIVSGF
jgi:hypothetical protein